MKARSALWIAIVSVSLSVGGCITLFGHVANAIRDFKTDWLIFWFVSRNDPSAVYVNFDRLPFPYPPPALLFLKPFGLLPVWWSLALWSVLGVAAIFLASRSFAKPGPFLLAMLMPASVECLLNGQTALFMGALVMAGLRYPALWGLGGILKPHSFVAIPFTRQWRSMGIAAGVAVFVFALSVAVLGWSIWPRWFAFLADFREAVIARHVSEFSIGPAYFARAILGAAATVIVFRKPAPMLDHYAALASSAFLISPYSMPYDLAGLSIAAAVMLFDREASPLRWVAAGWMLSGLFPLVGTTMFVAVLIGDRLMASHSYTDGRPGDSKRGPISTPSSLPSSAAQSL